MNDPNNRKAAFEGIIAFSLAALSLGSTASGSFFALPLVTFAAGIGCNWASNLIERGYHALIDNQFIDDKDLNHDIARVLTEAFKDAVQQMERSWKNSAECKELQCNNQEAANHMRTVLGWMKQDANTILEKTTIFDYATGNQTVEHLLRTHSNDRQQAEIETNAALDTALATYFYGCDPRLKTFFRHHFPPQWHLRFREKLKDPGNQGTKAWRAYQLVWHERMMGNLDLLNEHIIEILIQHRAAEHLNDTNRHALRDKLLACPAIKNRDTRADIVKTLQVRIPITIPRHDVDQIDVANIINTCLAYPFGIQHLIQVVLAYEDDTNAIQALEKFLRQVAPVLGIGNIALLKHLATLEPSWIASIYLDTTELDKLFRDSCPDVGHPWHGFDESDTLTCMLFDLARQGMSHTNTHPLLEFVNRLATHPQAVLVHEQLGVWCAETSQCLCLEPPATTVPEPPSSPSEAKTWLQVVLEPDAFNPQKVQVQAWVVCENAPEDPPPVYVSDVPQSLDEVAATFDQILSDAYALSNIPGELSAIEFFLDPAMLYHNVDHWECLDEDGEPYTLLGIEHAVIVRSRERIVAPPTQDTKKHQSWVRQRCLWEKKWSRLEAYIQGQESIPNGAIDLIDHTDDCSKQALRARLIDDTVVCVFSAFRPESDISKAILNVGIPVMLCPSKEASDHQNEDEVGTLLKALRQHIQSHGLADIDAHVHAERRKAFQDSKEMRPGRFITFLWDDYSRLPPIAEAPPKATAPGKRAAHGA